MQTIRNKTARPLRVPLPGGKTLHLNPGGTGQVSDKALEHATVKKLVEEDAIELVGGAGPSQASGGTAAPAHGSTHGHPPPTVVKPSGDR
jgi:hypothetical protein